MIDLATENVMPLSEAARTLPGRPAVSSVWRWCQKGIAGVRLESLVVGGRRCVSTESLQRFAERVTAAKEGKRPPSRTSRQRQRAVAEAEKTLVEAGIVE